MLNQNSEERYICQTCGIVFATSFQLTTHLRIHARQKPQSTFVQTDNLKAHLTNHTEEKNFKCNKCDAAFSQKDYLEDHLLTHAEGANKLLDCQLCNSKFADLFRLQIHMRMHTDERNSIRCRRCSTTFSGFDDLKRHMYIHEGERQYQCEHCDAAFKNRGTLRSHIKIHSGKKMFSCQECNAAFSKSHFLNRHIRTQCPGKDFKCKICRSVFSQKIDLNEHMRLHSSENDAKCKAGVDTASAPYDSSCRSDGNHSGRQSFKLDTPPDNSDYSLMVKDESLDIKEWSPQLYARKISGDSLVEGVHSSDVSAKSCEEQHFKVESLMTTQGIAVKENCVVTATHMTEINNIANPEKEEPDYNIGK